MRSKIYLPFLIAVFLSSIAIWRTDFTFDKIRSPLIGISDAISKEALSSLFQDYKYLGKGRQSFVFQSLDGKTVLKFFNRSYFEMPWYGYFSEKEKEKRERRKSFYLQSYGLAQKYLPEETGILYLHMGQTEDLPVIELKDRTNRVIRVDLNKIPFVLQRKAKPLYEAILGAKKEMREQILVDFLKIVSQRIRFGIADAEHQIEHNFGFLEGKPLYLDPGRLFLSDFSKEERLLYEWWSATHNLRKWLVIHCPEIVPFFDSKQNELRDL